MNINKEFRIVFQPKELETFGKRRFAVGAYSLHKYVGHENANKALLRALNCKEDNMTIKLRKFGRIDFYGK